MAALNIKSKNELCHKNVTSISLIKYTVPPFFSIIRTNYLRFIGETDILTSDIIEFTDLLKMEEFL